MSYLMEFEATARTKVVCNRTTFGFAVKWRGVRGTVWFYYGFTAHAGVHMTAYYVRHSRLGELLFWNHESERKFIRDAFDRSATEKCASMQFQSFT